MASWPWPLDAVENWFHELWNWVGTAAYNAVNQVFGWVNNAVSGIYNTVTGWVTWLSNSVNSLVNWLAGVVNAGISSIYNTVTSWINWLWSNINTFFSYTWNAINSGLAGVTTYISGVFSNLGSLVSNALSQAYAGLSGMLTNTWNSLSGAISGVGTLLWQGITGLGGAITSGLGGLWNNISTFFTNIAAGINSGIGAVGTAISSGFSGFTGLINGLLSGFASAFGTALQSAVTGVTSTLTSVAGTVIQIVNQNVITPLMSVLSWILGSVSSVLSGLWNSIVSTLRGAGVGTPETAVILSVPLLLTSVSAVFVMGVLGAVGDIKIMGCGIQLSSLTNQLIAAFGITHFASAVFSPILSAAYSQPVKYYWDSVFRPTIVSTGQADQMFFEENITEDQWHQVYAYHGWKEADIAAWEATMWREPSVLVLRGMASDPGTDMVWVRKKLRENGLIGEDADAVLAYGKRAALKDERNALATQIETDYRNNVIEQAEATADLTALAFMPEEVAFKIQKVQFLIARDARAAALKASAIPVAKLKSLTEAEIDMEFKLGLSTPEKYVQNLMDFGFSSSAAQRKYAIAVTPKPLTSTEKTRLIDALNDKIAKAQQRYGYQLTRMDLNLAYYADALEYLQTDTSLEQRSSVVQAQINKAGQRYTIALARQDLNLAFYTSEIEYLSGLEKPPIDRIATLQLQLTKAQGEKQLIEQQRDNELADLNAELAGPFKPPGARIQTLNEQITKAAGEKQLILQEENDEIADYRGQLKVLGVAG